MSLAVARACDCRDCRGGYGDWDVLLAHRVRQHLRQLVLACGRLLEAGADRGDAMGVEAEPVHPADVAGVLDLEAAVHDHGDAAVLGDLRALAVDDAELAPQGASADPRRLPGDRRQRVRGAEHVHDVHRLGDVRQARIALLPEDLALAGVHRDHVVAVPPEVVADEVAGPQLVLRQPHDRDRLRGVQHPLDLQRVLVPCQIEIAHEAASEPTVAATRAKPCSRSQIRSSTDSRPTDNRTVPGLTPAARSSSSLSCRCVVLAGWMTRLFASPTLARWDHRDMPRMRSWPPSRPPAQSNENTAPAPRGRYFSTSGRYRLDGRPA